MSKCTAHLICEVHRKLTMSVALSFGFDRSFLWSTELQHNLVSIQPHMIERLRLRYFELSSISAPHDSAAPEHQQQLPVPQQLDQLHGRLRDDDEPSPRTLAQAHVVDTIDGDGCSMRGRVETFFVRWDDFTQRYCMKSNKGRDECVLQAFRHGRRPHDAEFDRLYDLFSWLLHESRLLFSPGEPAALTTAAAGPEALCRSVDEPIAITVTAGADQEPAAGDDLPPATLRSLAIRTDPAGVTPAVSPVHADLARSLGVFFGRDSDVVQGFLDADFVFSSPDGRALRWRSYLLAHLMRDITDAVLGLFGLRQTKCDDYPAAQLRQIHDSVLCRADIAISPQRWAELYRQCVDGTHLDMGEDGLSPPTAMDAAWAELADILGAVFADVGKLVRAVVDFLCAPVTAAPSARGSPDPAATADDHARLTSFPNHNQIHVLGNLLQLPVMQREPYCHALSSLLPNDEYWHVVAPLCEAGAATTSTTTTTTDGRALQAAAVSYLACMVRLNARRLDRLELLKPLIRSWITDGARPDFTDELMADLRYFGGVWGSLIIHDIIAGIHGFVTRSIRGYDTRALKQRIVGVVASVLGGALLGPHFARIVRGGSGDADAEQNDSEQADAATALENLLLALRVIDQFGVLKVRCLPHDSLMFVRRNCAPAAERLLDETFNRALNDSAVVLERLMGVASPTGTSVIDRLTAAVLRAIALESPPAATPPRKADDGEGDGDGGDDGNAEETTRRQQLVDVVRSAVEKMCIGTASGAAVTQSVLPPLPPHTARRQTRKLVRTRRKLEQEAEGPVRVMLDAFFADARRLVAAFHQHHHHPHQHHPLLASALHDVTLALDGVRGA